MKGQTITSDVIVHSVMKNVKLCWIGMGTAGSDI